MHTVGIGFALAVVTSTQLLVPPSFAYADTSAPTTAPASATRSSGRAKATTGWVVFGIGGAVLVGGIVLDVLAAGKNTVSGSGGSGDTGTTHDAKTNLLWGGTTMIVAGVLAGIYGGSLILAGNRQVDSQQAQTPPATVDSVAKAAQASLASGPAFVMPIVSAHF